MDEINDLFVKMKEYVAKKSTVTPLVKNPQNEQVSRRWQSEKLLGPRLLGNVLDARYKIGDVEKTNCSGANIRTLLNEFNSAEFSQKSDAEIASLCGEINQRVAKMLKIKPCTTKIVNFSNSNKVVSGLAGSNSIFVSKKSNARGIDYLFNILKASFSSYLEQNRANLASGQKFDKLAIVNKVQKAISCWEDGFEPSVKDKGSLKNLEDIETDLFAYENLMNLREKGLKFGLGTIEYLQERGNLNFSSDVFNWDERAKMQDTLKDGYYNIKQIYNENKKFAPRGVAFCLENAFSELTEEDFDTYFDNLSRKIGAFKNFVQADKQGR